MRIVRYLLLGGLLGALYLTNPTEVDFGRSRSAAEARTSGHALFSLPSRLPTIERRDDYVFASVFTVRDERSLGDLRRYLGIAGIVWPLPDARSE